MKAVLLFCCEGRVDNGFTFCSGVSNQLLDFEVITHTKNYRFLIEYIDQITKLFQGPCFDGNRIMNTIYKAYELEYLTDELYRRCVDLFQWHKRCGVYLKLQPKE